MIKVIEKKLLTFGELPLLQNFLAVDFPEGLWRKVPPFEVDRLMFNAVKLIWRAGEYVLTYACCADSFPVIPVKITNIKVEVEKI